MTESVWNGTESELSRPVATYSVGESASSYTVRPPITSCRAVMSMEVVRTVPSKAYVSRTISLAPWRTTYAPFETVCAPSTGGSATTQQAIQAIPLILMLFLPVRSCPLRPQ